MFSLHKKILLDLFKLKNEKDLISVEKYFDNYLRGIFNLKKKELKKQKKCLCGSKIIINKVKIGFFDYITCICGNVYISPMFNDKQLSQIYSQKGPYKVYRNKFLENKSKEKLRKTLNRRKALQTLSVLKFKSKSILDLGCGNGDFLKNCKSIGFKKLYGVDTKYQDKVFSEHKINYSNSVKNFSKISTFDCITLWGVLEHLQDPIKYTKNIIKNIKKGGFLIFEVPFSDSLLMSFILKKKKPASRFLEPGRHLHFFSKKFFTIFAKKINFKIIDFETNGLDIQTITGKKNKNLTKDLLLTQNTLDELKISDHARVVFKKIN